MFRWKSVNNSLSSPPKLTADKPENQVKLKELQNLVMSYLENLKQMESSPAHIEDCDKYKKLIQILKQEYITMYPSEESLITKIFAS